VKNFTSFLFFDRDNLHQGKLNDAPVNAISHHRSAEEKLHRARSQRANNSYLQILTSEAIHPPK
jgi:hypothetical protein